VAQGQGYSEISGFMQVPATLRPSQP